MPFYLIQDLINLYMQEFEIAIDYWMNYFRFSYATEELTAYDEGIYPDDHRKPTGRRYQYNAKSNNAPEQRSTSLRLPNSRRVFSIPTLIHSDRDSCESASRLQLKQRRLQQSDLP
jgi:hypothetical protein